MRRKRWDGKPDYADSVESIYNVPEFISMRDLERTNYLSNQQNRTVLKKQYFLKCYQKTFFNVRKTCELVGICTKTYYNWYNADEEFKKAVFLAEQGMRTDVEDMLKRLILKGDGPSIRWTLTRIHPKYRPAYKTTQIKRKGPPIDQQAYEDEVNAIIKAVLDDRKKKEE